MSKIQAVILDVDGVIIGEKIGYNSPYPHEQVTQTLKQIRASGIPVILCTAKPAFAIEKIVVDACLDNLHITDGGAVVVDLLANKILSKHLIPNATVKKIVSTLLDENIYTEIYTPTEYIVQKSQVGSITKDHQHVLQAPARVVDSLLELIDDLEIVKIMPIATDPAHKQIVDTVLQQFVPEVMVSWGVHPVILPLQFGIVTAPLISKEIAALEIMKSLQIEMANVLGAGDSVSDWQFIKSCGYAVAMGNAAPELKSLVASKGQDNYFIAPSVDENGIVEGLRFFGL